jgi:hypothetical protein
MASSTVVAREAQVTRPQAVTAAVVITVATTLLSFPLMFLPGMEDVPTGAIIFSIVASVVTLFSAWGLWQLRRWGAIVTFVLTLLNVLSSIPAFIERPSGWIVAWAAISIPISIAVLVLIALPSSRRAYR